MDQLTETKSNPSIDLDDFINKLIKENEHFKNIIESLRSEIKIQRKEIAALREERRIILGQDREIHNFEWE
jgi:predicted RNase H-like nuclease (RuvC/YqgF family)